ncbi:MAG: monovalent cation/H(+) antiporter subunit G, partial [Vicinamibacterales bacterium]|nr:monovalent cation/H(+) antiporter subunit G [Vicinamibacterales bacterium]
AAGALLLLIAGIGVLRMPDLFLRMSATSKASSLGAGCMLLAVAVSAAEFSVTVRALLGVAFLFLTTPVASHMIGRAAYLLKVQMFQGMVCDDLRGKYDARTASLRGDDPANGAADAGRR